MTTVLLLGLGGNVSQGILTALRAGREPVRIVGACVTPMAAGLHLADRALISPHADDPGFEPWLLETIERERIDAVLSGVEPVLTALAALDVPVPCVVSAPQALAVGADKLGTARWLERQGLPFPRTELPEEAASLITACGFPLVAKPRQGKGSHGVHVVHDTDELRAAVAPGGYVVQEHLAGEEFTAGTFSDRDGIVRGAIALRRTLHAGTTATAVAGDFPEVRALARTVAERLRPLGPLNVQLRLHDGVPTPFELNVRFSGTTPIRTHLGFDEVGAALRHLVRGDPPEDLPDVTAGVALRMWTEVYPRPEALAALEQEGRADP